MFVFVKIICFSFSSSSHFLKQQTVKFLVERGANINSVDRFGGTPLSEALDAKRDDIASYLRENGANLGNRQEQLIRKVCEAAAKGLVSDLENVYNNSFLTLVESRDYDWRSPLHLAVANGHVEVFFLSPPPFFLFLISFIFHSFIDILGGEISP